MLVGPGRCMWVRIHGSSVCPCIFARKGILGPDPKGGASKANIMKSHFVVRGFNIHPSISFGLAGLVRGLTYRLIPLFLFHHAYKHRDRTDDTALRRARHGGLHVIQGGSAR